MTWSLAKGTRGCEANEPAVTVVIPIREPLARQFMIAKDLPSPKMGTKSFAIMESATGSAIGPSSANGNA